MIYKINKIDPAGNIENLHTIDNIYPLSGMQYFARFICCYLHKEHATSVEVIRILLQISRGKLGTLIYQEKENVFTFVTLTK